MRNFKYHKELAAGGWQRFNLMEQMANIGSEVGRARKWQGKDEKLFQSAVERALELFDLTLEDPRWRTRLREIARAREVFLDAVLGGEEYGSTLEDLDRYFSQFAFASKMAAGH
ncbi:MAG: hypothetical protein Q8P66_02430 [Candidatus Colwellbacteria bacterium]|nr:hypothetical protein [Candidatus Colwellbacteria bacterium]